MAATGHRLEKHIRFCAMQIRPPNAISKGKEADIPIRRQSLSVIPGTDSVTIGRDADSAGGSSPLGSGSVLSASPNNLSSGRRGFTFDRVFGPDVTQQAFYHDCCSSLIQQFMDGFNVTIFAYGQTSSGKTYSIGTSSSPEVPPEHVGIIPRAIGQVMGAVQKQPEDTAVQFSVKCTFLEIYQEQVRDLLRPEAKDISIREDKNGVTTVVGIHEEDISSADDLLRCLEKGNLERTTGDTKMHLYSSRSHAVFTILLEQRAGDPFMNHGSENISKAPLKCSKLHLIDLAGSERLKRTGAEGVRLKESVKINSGLLALGNVISLLSGSDGQERPQSQPQHVPYRDSKLTRLLRDSLGGNAKTLMVACVSPCEEDYDETLNTLKYADRARRIQNRPIVNIVDAQRAKVLEMRERIDFLESQLVIERTNSQDRRVETPAKKAEASPDLSSDLGSDQLLGRLMEELRSRTIRGTNAIKALKEMTEENDALKARTSAVEVELENSRSFQMAVADELEVAKQEQTKSLQELQSAISDTMRLAEFAITVSPFVPKENAEGIEQLIRRYITNAEIKFKPKDDKVPDTASVPVSPSKPSFRPHMNIFSRHRRRDDRSKKNGTIDTSDHSAIDLDTLTELRRVEEALQESEKARSELESALEIVRGQLETNRVLNTLTTRDTESQTQPLLSFMDALQSICVPEDLLEVLTRLDFDLGEDFQAIKEVVVAEIEGGDEEFPVHTRQSDMRTERSTPFKGSLTTSSSSTTLDMPELAPLPKEDSSQRIRVELQRELAKKTKEMDRIRQQMSDKLLKGEKDLEAALRDGAKLRAALAEMAQAKESVKEELEKRIKQLEAQLSKARARSKELEKHQKEKEAAERRASDMQADIDKLHVTIASLKKRAKEEAEKVVEIENRRAREAAAAARSQEEAQRLVRSLKNMIETLQRRLDRKRQDTSKEGMPHVPDGEDELDYSQLEEEFCQDSDAAQILAVLRTSNFSDSKRLVVGCLRELIEMRTTVQRASGPKGTSALDVASQTEFAASEAATLQRELLYYKTTNKGLKGKLKDMVALNQKLVAANKLTTVSVLGYSKEGETEREVEGSAVTTEREDHRRGQPGEAAC